MKVEHSSLSVHTANLNLLQYTVNPA